MTQPPPLTPAPAPPAPFTRPPALASPTAIDPSQLSVLVRTFFRINTRGNITRSLGKQGRFGLWGILIFYGLMGLSMGFYVMLIKAPFLYFIILHAITLMFIGMATLVESGQVLFNPAEKDILTHLPVSPRTVVAAKLLSLTGFTMLLAFAYNLGPFFFILALPEVRWWAPLAHLFCVILLCLFCGGTVICFYGLLARAFGRQRFETVVSWAQIGLSIAFVLVYQLMMPIVRSMEKTDISREMFWLWAAPPTWFAGLDTLLARGAGGRMELVASALALGLTAAAVYFGIGRLAAGEAHEKQTHVPSAETPHANAPARPLRPLAPWLRRWMPDPAEQALFRLAAAYLRRDRDIRQRLYPALAMVLVLPLVMMFQGVRMASGSAISMALGFWMLLTLPLTATETLRFCAHYQASDLFFYAPLRNDAPLFHGVAKATLYYICLPVSLLMVAVMVGITGDPPAVLKAALPILISLPTLTLLGGTLGQYIPLARPARIGDQTSRSQLPLLVMMVISPLMLGAFYFTNQWGGLPLTLLIEIPLLLLTHILLRRKLNAHPGLITK